MESVFLKVIKKAVMKSLTQDNLLPVAEFLTIRDQKRKDLLEIKKNRRVMVGPDITFYFENYDTLWWQIQEMLRIEGGGEEQMREELAAYAPLVPQVYEDGRCELVATMMIEIDDLIRRKVMLQQWSGIERYVYLDLGDGQVQAIADDDIDRTAEDGKTSSVHFLRFTLSKAQSQRFCAYDHEIFLGIHHPYYSHQIGLSLPVRKSLALDWI